MIISDLYIMPQKEMESKIIMQFLDLIMNVLKKKSEMLS